MTSRGKKKGTCDVPEEITKRKVICQGLNTRQRFSKKGRDKNVNKKPIRKKGKTGNSGGGKTNSLPKAGVDHA